jgi:uncharacterized membrane protein
MNAFMTLQLLAAIGTGLTAGIFYAFSTFVMAALGRLEPRQGMSAMNAINVAVINPWFMAVFLGTPAICAVLAVWAVTQWNEPGGLMVIGASLIYIAGSLLVTMIFNVPLNNALAATASQGSAETWDRYLNQWTRWNHLRTLLSLVAMILFIIGLIDEARTLPSA